MDNFDYALLLLPIGTFLFHEYFFANYEAKHSTIRRRRKEVRENWRKRASKMNLPSNASMARICQAEDNERRRNIKVRNREIERERALEGRVARKRANIRRLERRKQQALDDMIDNKLGQRYLNDQINIVDKRYGGEDHAPPEAINEMLSQFKTEFGESPSLNDEEVARRMKKQDELETLTEDDFLNRLPRPIGDENARASH